MWSGKAPVKRCLQLFPLRIIGGVFQTQGLGSQNEHLVALHPKRRTQGRVISILAEFSTVQLSLSAHPNVREISHGDIPGVSENRIEGIKLTAGRDPTPILISLAHGEDPFELRPA